MAWMKTSNPALSENAFRGEGVAYGDGMVIKISPGWPSSYMIWDRQTLEKGPQPTVYQK